MLTLLLLACGAPAEPELKPAPEPTRGMPPMELRTKWVDRTDAELDAELHAACARAASRGVNLLVEFSAEWCIDCKSVSAMKPMIAEELYNWERVTVNVGRFDRHKALVKAFEVGGIAHWVALAPSDCDQPVPAWPRLKSGVLEPSSGASGPKTPRDLQAWLEDARGS